MIFYNKNAWFSIINRQEFYNKNAQDNNNDFYN